MFNPIIIVGMRKSFLPWIATGVLLLASCNGQEPQTPPGDGTVDLSAGGASCSNCYLIGEAGKYSFDATVKGNGKASEGLEAPSTLSPQDAKLVWQTSEGMIENISCKDGSIYFEASGKNGNALLAALDGDGTIIWSWHIWFPEQAPSTLTTKSGYEIMDMNLGAMKAEFESEDDVKPYGMLYQWGRKDPFPAAPTRYGDTQTTGATLYDAEGNAIAIGSSSMASLADNTIEFATANPTVCISNMAQYYTSRDWLEASQSNDALWGNPAGNDRDENNDYPNKGSKSYYDPCPQGYRVPPADVFRTFTTSGGYTENLADTDIYDMNSDGTVDESDYNCGWIFNMESGHSFFPAAARYDGSYAMLYGSVSGLWGNYWSNAPTTISGTEGLGFSCLSFSRAAYGFTVSPTAGGAKADAYSVRCIKEQ